VARVAFFGAGYAGLVSGVCLADLGHTVVIRDVVPERIELLERGTVPFHEPALEELIARNRERLTFTLSMEEAVAGSDFLFVCVGTPPTPSGDANLAAVWGVIEELPADIGSPVLVMKSTVPVGTGEKVRAALDARGLDRVGYASCPEFLAEGTSIRTTSASSPSWSAATASPSTSSNEPTITRSASMKSRTAVPSARNSGQDA